MLFHPPPREGERATNGAILSLKYRVSAGRTAADAGFIGIEAAL